MGLDSELNRGLARAWMTGTLGMRVSSNGDVQMSLKYVKLRVRPVLSPPRPPITHNDCCAPERSGMTSMACPPRPSPPKAASVMNSQVWPLVLRHTSLI